MAEAAETTARYQGQAATCSPSSCDAPPLVADIERAVAGCAAGATMNASSVCTLGCADGYAASNATTGVCKADVNGTSASYQGHSVTCTQMGCVAPRLTPGQLVVSGCVAGGAVSRLAVVKGTTFAAHVPGAPCELGCEDGWLPLRTIRATCEPTRPGSPIAAYDFGSSRLLCTRAPCDANLAGNDLSHAIQAHCTSYPALGNTLGWKNYGRALI